MPFKPLVLAALRLTLLAWAGTALVGNAIAQSYPDRPVHLIVHNTPGSAPDVLARFVGHRLTETWGQSVVVENRTGAAGVLAADALAKAPPDGYKLLVGGDGPITILPNLQKNLPYDARRDLLPVVPLGQIDFVLVAHPKSGLHSVGDFVRAAKAQPGRLNYASAGNGSALQFAMELLKQRAGVFATHIPYRGGPLGLQDVIAGQVDLMFIAIGPALPHIRSGRLVALATSGEQRNALLPDVPTVAETYPGFRAGTWFGLFAPAGTPQTVLDPLAAEVNRILRSPGARQELAAQGIEAASLSQQAFARQVSTEYTRYAQIVKTAGIKAD